MVLEKELERKRYLFTCEFQDTGSGAEGKIQALVLWYIKEKMTQYEKFTIVLEKPKYEKINIVDFNLEDPYEMIPKDTPRGT